MEAIAVAKGHILAVASEAFAFRALYALLTVMAATVAMAVRSKKAGRGAAPPVSRVHLRRAQYLPWQRREAAVTGRNSPTAGWNVGASLARRERSYPCVSAVFVHACVQLRTCSPGPPRGLPGAFKPDVPHFDL